MGSGSFRPAVSVITTIYNNERFLGEAIESVFSQSISDWELILVDDGSSDKSICIAEDYVRRDRRLSLHCHRENQNLGISASRNVGIKCATAPFIAFLDADDIYYPHKLESQLNSLCKFPEAAMTSAAAIRWHSWNQGTPSSDDLSVPSALPGWGADCLIHPPALLHAFLKDESLTPCTCSVLIRREAITAAGGFESSFRGLYDDQVFYAKIALSEMIYLSSDCVAAYRQHPQSCCASARRRGDSAGDRMRFLAWLKEYEASCTPLRSCITA